MSREARRSSVSVFVPVIVSVAPSASVQEAAFAATFPSEKFPLLTISSKSATFGSATFPSPSTAAFTAKDLFSPTVSVAKSERPETPSVAPVSSVTVRLSCSGVQSLVTKSESPFSTAISFATSSSVVAGVSTLTTVVSPSASEPITSLPASTTEPRVKPLPTFPSSVTVSPLSVRFAPKVSVCAERSTRTSLASSVPSRPFVPATSALRTSMLPPVATSAPPSSVSESVWKFAVSSASRSPMTTTGAAGSSPSAAGRLSTISVPLFPSFPTVTAATLDVPASVSVVCVAAGSDVPASATTRLSTPLRSAFSKRTTTSAPAFTSRSVTRSSFAVNAMFSPTVLLAVT